MELGVREHPGRRLVVGVGGLPKADETAVRITTVEVNEGTQDATFPHGEETLAGYGEADAIDQVMARLLPLVVQYRLENHVQDLVG